jgi:hypothetical protein
MAGLAASVIEIINRHAGHYTAWFKFSTLLRKQERAFAASLIVKLGDWVTLRKT